jgi:outer membrane protein
VEADVTDHPQLKALVMGVEAAALEVRKQQAAHGPTLDATAGYGHNFSSGSMTSPTEVQSRSRAAQVGLQFNLPLYAGGVVASRVREAMAQQERAEAELAMLHGQLLMQVSQYQQAWLRSRDQIQALAEAVEASHALVEASLIGYRIGTRINLDVLNAEQQRASAERDVFKACADAAMFRLRLKAAQGQLGADDLTQVDEILKVE